MVSDIPKNNKASANSDFVNPLPIKEKFRILKSKTLLLIQFLSLLRN